MTRSRLLVLLIVPVLVLAAGCGDDEGGGGGGGEDEITKVLQTGLTSSEPKVVCEGTYSTSLLRRTYGDAARCRQIEAEDAKDDKPAKSVDVSDIKIDGGKATATVKLTGGDQGGATGSLNLVEQDGSWRVDDLSPDFLRAELRASMKNDTDIPEQAKTCLGEKILGLPDAELKELAYGSIGEQPAAQRKLVGYLAECDTGEGTSALRQQFEQGIAESMEKDGASAEQIKCVRDALRDSITDEDIAEIAGNQSEGGNPDLPPGIQKAAEDAFRKCGAGGSGGGA